jgi:hypothetical protein
MYRRQLLQEELEVDEEQSEHERRVRSGTQDDEGRFRRHAPQMDDVPGGDG